VRAAQHLAIDRHDALTLLGECRHEALERRTELGRIEQPEQPAECVMAGQTVVQTEELTQEWLVRLGEFGPPPSR
jgi:hypothetical protein